MRQMRRAIAVALILTACSSGDDSVVGPGDTNAPPPRTEPDADASPDLSPTEIATERPSSLALDAPLGDVCPDVITIQLGALPSVESGPLITLLGDSPDYDEDVAALRAPLTRVDGTVEDVQLEIRSGGPPVGFAAPLDQLAGDPTIHFAVSSITAAADSPSDVVGIAALGASTRHALVWDPATYPDVETIADLGQAEVEVRHVTDSRAIDFLIENEILNPAQTVSGFDGEPAAFVAADGSIAQLGDLLIDPPLFTALPQWSRPVTAASLATTGWSDIDDVLFVRESDQEELGACMARLVRLVQEATVSYATAPTPTNGIIAITRSQLDPLSRITVDLLDAAVERGTELGVHSNGHDDTAGNFDLDALNTFLADSASSSAALVTNDYIDAAIGF